MLGHPLKMEVWRQSKVNESSVVGELSVGDALLIKNIQHVIHNSIKEEIQ